MSSSIGALSSMLLILFFFQRCYVSALTNSLDASALRALKNEWTRSPKGWEGSDPCGTNWVGITCTNNRVVSISLVNHNLEGTLSEYISALSELEILDLSFNTGLTGPLPPNIGDLKKLKKLILMGCSFSGQIPESVGSLEQLINLSLNSNKFNGTIPASVGWLSKLDWFDIDDNRIEGELPISNGTSPGLDMLLQTQHFHFGSNKLSGEIPEKLFSSNMTLIHVLFNDNQFTGKIPKSLGLVTTMLMIRLDTNRLSGEIPPSLNNLRSLDQLHLANNKFTGSLPNLAGLTHLDSLNLSNNTLEPSLIPSWVSSLHNLSILRMEGIQLTGSIPISLFSLVRLQYVNLKHNQINGTLDFGTNYSKQLELVHLRYNNITGYKQAANERILVILENNPVCGELGNKPSFCSVIQHPSSFSNIPTNCSPCDQGKEPSPTCRCAYPIPRTLYFKSFSFSRLFNSTNFSILQHSIVDLFKKFIYNVDSVAVRNIRENAT